MSWWSRLRLDTLLLVSYSPDDRAFMESLDRWKHTNPNALRDGFRVDCDKDALFIRLAKEEWKNANRYTYFSVFSSRISRPPGSTMISCAEFLCSNKSLEQVLKPLIADMQHEYFEALSQGSVWKARWIRVRYGWSFSIALGLLRILKTFADVWRAANFR